MHQNIKVFDCFFDIRCCCLSNKLSYDEFFEKCMLPCKNNCFVIKDISIGNAKTFAACCKDFTKFQVENIDINGSFSLFKFNCNHSWTVYSGDVKSNDSLFEIYHASSDSDFDLDSDNDSDNENETICYNLFKNDLKFENFCEKYTNIFLKICSKNLHLISKKDLYNF